MVERNPLISQFIGTSIGAVQTPLLRQFVDNPATPLIGGIGSFGQASALIGIISGVITLGAGIFGSTRRGGAQQRMSDTAVLGLIGHGTVALETGVLSGLFPTTTVATVGGMEGQYVPPGAQSMGADMNMLNSMSAELQRLQTENMELKNMQTGTYPATMPPGSVVDKQYRYGFMEPQPQEYIAPGQPTKAARELGFMARPGHGRMPLAKVQEMKGRYGFLG